jgi:cytochrome b pre-mRNA-processing protein 3
MLRRLFGKRSRANRAITDSVYAGIVTAARQAEFYSHAEVPDTPLGRFEMLCLHLFLLLHRLRGLEGAAAELAQDVTDVFIEDIDHSLRELGIGDIGIPRRVKKLARMFYGRAHAYGEALDRGDMTALAGALHRNIQPDRPDWPQAQALAQYAAAASRHLADQPVDLILRGKVEFAAPEGWIQ